MNFEQISKFLIAVIPVISLSCAVFIYLYIKSVFERRKKIELFQNEFQKIKESNQEIINTYGNLSYIKNESEKLQKEKELKEKQLLVLDAKRDLIEKEIKDKTEFNNSLLKIREEELDRTMALKKEREIERVDREVSDWEFSAQEAASEYFNIEYSALEEQINTKKEELRCIVDEIEDYRAKVDAINAEILRARAIEEKQDFYRVQLDDKSKEDIQVLNDIRQRLNKIDLLNKLIYENYISRPTKEMIKRVLEGKNPSGIYKVTNIKTNEIYIGKSVKIADRFQNHVKSACGLEGVAESQFQRALKKYGVDGFTWELLEEVPKENLNEREKYYIIFYGTKDYGYNQREG